MGLASSYCFPAFALASITIAGSAPTATIEAGVVVGTSTTLPNAAALVNKFLGVPFAQSPPERFSPPRAATEWSAQLNTTAWKPACIQQFNYPESTRNITMMAFNNPPVEESEDCLYLNIYAPAAPAAGNDSRAVMFWLYGGALQFGDAGMPYYDGSAFAAYEDVVVVTANYRTNVFGFPASTELPLTSRNLGFLDQRFALDWVQKNIHAFGGDKKRVTIFGESAGAFSIDALLTSFPKDSNPPFQAAILESGQYSYRTSVPTSSAPAWNTLAALLNCSSQVSNLTCIRNAPAIKVKDIIERNVLIFNPVADNATLVKSPATTRRSGNLANVPVLCGTNAQEGRVFMIGQNNITAFLTSYFASTPVLQEAIARAYPLGRDGLNTDYDVISQIYTELRFQCPQARFANDSANASIPTWRYYFNASFPNTQPFLGLGVYHSSEIPLVFSSYPTANATFQEVGLSNFMRGTWAGFAKDPLAGPGWKAKAAGGADDLDLSVLGSDGSIGFKVIRERNVDSRCDLFNAIYDAVNAAM